MLCRAMGTHFMKPGLASTQKRPHHAVKVFIGTKSGGKGKSVLKSLFCTLWGSLSSTEACKYRFAGLCAKGFTVFIINTINRFVVLL